MPRPLSEVWKHFTPACVSGKAVYICNYCAQPYVKNATKLQRHIVKCLMSHQGSMQAATGKSFSVNIRSEDDSSVHPLDSSRIEGLMNGLLRSGSRWCLFIHVNSCEVSKLGLLPKVLCVISCGKFLEIYQKCYSSFASLNNGKLCDVYLHSTYIA